MNTMWDGKKLRMAALAFGAVVCGGLLGGCTDDDGPLEELGEEVDEIGDEIDDEI
jgi:hypothetical protein